MHPRTEDLLTIRDGEPMESTALERARAAPDFAHELERLVHMRRALDDLPELDTPQDGWGRVLESLDSSPPGRRAWWPWALRGAVAAAVAVGAMAYLMRAGQVRPTDPPALAATPSAVVQPATAAPAVPASFVSLVQQSERLERMLAEIPYQRPLMSGRTASMIVGLEDRIAYIDEQLTYGVARGLSPPQQQALWSERVELMNALVHVRLGQAEPAGF